MLLTECTAFVVIVGWCFLYCFWCACDKRCVGGGGGLWFFFCDAVIVFGLIFIVIGVTRRGGR